jgi:hypothetical protein
MYTEWKWRALHVEGKVVPMVCLDVVVQRRIHTPASNWTPIGHTADSHCTNRAVLSLCSLQQFCLFLKQFGSHEYEFKCVNEI